MTWYSPIQKMFLVNELSTPTSAQRACSSLDLNYSFQKAKKIGLSDHLGVCSNETYKDAFPNHPFQKPSVSDHSPHFISFRSSCYIIMLNLSHLTGMPSSFKTATWHFYLNFEQHLTHKKHSINKYSMNKRNMIICKQVTTNNLGLAL